MKMTFQPKKRQRSKVHGFRSRMSTAGGRKVLAARRAKGRAKSSVWKNGKVAWKNKGEPHYVCSSPQNGVIKGLSLSIFALR